MQISTKAVASLEHLSSVMLLSQISCWSALNVVDIFTAIVVVGCCCTLKDAPRPMYYSTVWMRRGALTFPRKCSGIDHGGKLTSSCSSLGYGDKHTEPPGNVLVNSDHDSKRNHELLAFQIQLLSGGQNAVETLTLIFQAAATSSGCKVVWMNW
eukprot:gene30889-38176_t